MKLPKPESKTTPLFYLEIPSEQPENMAQFYCDALSIKFYKTTYPFPHYRATLGEVALIISKPVRLNNGSMSGAGKVTLGVMTRNHPSADGERWFLPPHRPLGAFYPDRYAQRLQDPDGNYLALVTSMEEMIGRVPECRSLRDLVAHTRDYARFAFGGFKKAVRHRIDDVIDNWEYASGRVSKVREDWRGFTHVVASREGLYLVNRSHYKRVMRGAFYGVTLKDGAIYCFQSCGREEENKGRILKISLTPDGDAVADVSVIAKGLDDGCHQIDFIGDDLFVVDCYNGKILEIRLGNPGYVSHCPLGSITRDYARNCVHMNSLLAHPDGTIWVLLHNHNDKPSEILVLSQNFDPVRRFYIRAGAAHNIVFTNDALEYLVADSSGARIISAHGVVAEINMMRPRGVSLDEDVCVVGDSFYSTRIFRRYVPGRVHFFDRRTWTCISTLTLPAAPTEIRRLDGNDLSLSNYVRSQARTDARYAATVSVTERQLT